MEFCPKCGAILIQKRTRWSCPKCSYATNQKIKLNSSEVKEKVERVEVLKEKDAEVFPVISVICPKCNYNKAYFWTVQMRSGDEAETRFFRCTKCNTTWRERD